MKKLVDMSREELWSYLDRMITLVKNFNSGADEVYNGSEYMPFIFELGTRLYTEEVDEYDSIFALQCEDVRPLADKLGLPLGKRITSTGDVEYSCIYRGVGLISLAEEE